MSHTFSPPPGFGAAAPRRLHTRKRVVDWRVVALTAASAVTLIATLGRPF